MEGSHSGTTAVSDDDHICNVMEPLTERDSAVTLPDCAASREQRAKTKKFMHNLCGDLQRASKQSARGN